MKSIYSAMAIGRLSAKDYGDYGWKVLILAALPRVLAEAFFLVLLGRVLSPGHSERFALMGVMVYIATLSTVARIVDVYLIDVEADSFDELRLGVRRYAEIVAIRCWPWCVEGFLYAVLTLLVVGPVVFGWGQTVRAAVLLPVVALACLTTAAFGLAVNALGLGHRVGGLMGALASLVLLACCGVIAPPPNRWARALGGYLPLTHAATALRNALAHRPVSGPLLSEIAVGVGWLCVAVMAVGWFRRRMYGAGVTP